MAAAPSPLAQAHRPPRSDAGSDSESDNELPAAQQQHQQAQDTSVQSVQERLAQLALIKEVDIDTSKLDALTPEVIANQATINIGEAIRHSGGRRPSCGRARMRRGRRTRLDNRTVRTAFTQPSAAGRPCSRPPPSACSWRSLYPQAAEARPRRLAGRGARMARWRRMRPGIRGR